MICFFIAQICYEIESWVNKIWIQHDPQLFCKVPSPSSFWFNLGYSCAPGKLSYKNAVLFLLFYLFCSRQIALLKAFCMVPVAKAVLACEVSRHRIGWKTQFWRYTMKDQAYCVLYPRNFPPNTLRSQWFTLEWNHKWSQVLFQLFLFSLPWPWMCWHLLLPCFLSSLSGGATLSMNYHPQ